MMQHLVIVIVCVGVAGCGGAQTSFPAVPSSTTQKSKAEASQRKKQLTPEEVPELIAALKSGKAKVNDFRLGKPGGVGLDAARAAMPELITLLKTGSPEVRREAAGILQNYVHNRDLASEVKLALPVLIAALNDPDMMVRRRSMVALMASPESKTNVALFLDAIKNSDPVVRMYAATTLGRIGSAKEVLPVLASAITDDESGMSAALALAQIGKPAVSTLAKLVGDNNPRVSMRTAIALANIGSLATDAAGELTKSAARNDGRAPWCQFALTMIDRKKYPPREAVLGLIEIAKNNKQTQLRDIAIEALGRIGPDAKAAVPLLIEVISERNFPGNAAFFAVGQIGAEAKDAVPALVEAMKRNYPRDRTPNYVAVETLGKLGSVAQAASPEMVKKFTAEKEDGHLRECLAEALGKVGPADKTVPLLVDALKDLSVRRAAILGLQAVGPEGKDAIPALLELLKDYPANASYPFDVTRALAAMGAEGVTALISVAQHPDASVRSAYGPAVQALGNLGPKAKAAVPMLVEAVGDEYRRQWAGPALKEIDPEKAAELGIK